MNLTELDMYDNKIKDVGEALDSLVDIVYVNHHPVSRTVPDLSLNDKDARSVIQLAASDPNGTPIPSEVEDRLLRSGPDISYFWA